VFGRGYEQAEAERKRQEAQREGRRNKLWTFFLTEDNDEALVRFLTEIPINFYEHNMQVSIGGRSRWEGFTCLGEIKKPCPLCENGDRAQLKGAYLVWDYREYEYTDEKGKKRKASGQVRLYIAGPTIVNQLGRISKRYGLCKQDITVSRSGAKKGVTYNFNREAAAKGPSKTMIENALPEALRELYDGSLESLNNIIEEQLKLRFPEHDDEDDGDEEDTRAEKKRRSKVSSGKGSSRRSKYDEDDEDEDEDDSDDEDDDLDEDYDDSEDDADEDDEDEEDEDDEEEQPRSRRTVTRKSAPPKKAAAKAAPAKKIAPKTPAKSATGKPSARKTLSRK
jgi:hypothetical protein